MSLSSNSPSFGGDFPRHAERLIDQGYVPIPIRAGMKAPGFEGWQKTKPSKVQVREWIAHGHKRSGLGVLTKNTPAIDIDVRDEEVVKLLMKFIEEGVGKAPRRIGRAPKCLLVFRTDTPFRKMRSNKYSDEWALEHQIEVLGEGQQFVAYHTHPDTGKPYAWPDEGMNPLEIRAEDLPVLTPEFCEELFDYFHKLADEREWDVQKAARLSGRAGNNSDNPWAEDTSPITIDDDELRKLLMLIPHPEDYDQWIQIGMALYHQYDGDLQGLDLWHAWAKSANNYDPDALDSRWETFSISLKGRAPITARLVVTLSKEATGKMHAELVQKLRNSFTRATSTSEWQEARKEAQRAEVDSLWRGVIANDAKAAHDRIFGSRTPVQEIRKAIAFIQQRAEQPNWLKDFVFNTEDDRFVDVETKMSYSPLGFNAVFDRKAMTKEDYLNGRTTPSKSAAQIALLHSPIPTVHGVRYLPSDEKIVSTLEGTFLNSYRANEVPQVPETLSIEQRKACDRFRQHVCHLFPSEHEQTLLIDWFAWIVQNPGHHVNYGLVLQGVQGDGKTFFGELMREVMGHSNVTMLDAQILHSDFTDWAAGQCLVCVEEVRLVNESNKYEVLNRIKPFITNRIIEIHPKGKPPRNVPNTTSYLLLTNYKDALPIDDTDRRYLILYSQWQKSAAIRDFKIANPEYYRRLYELVSMYAPAVRKYLLEWTISPKFNANGDAPETGARTAMINRSKPAFVTSLEDLITENLYAEISATLLDLTKLAEIFYERGLGDYPSPKSLSAILERIGFDRVGRLTLNGVRSNYYSQDASMFQDGSGQISRSAIERHLQARRTELSEI